MPEVYFMHTVFKTSLSEIHKFIDEFFDVNGTRIELGEMWLKVFQRKGYHFTWWYENVENVWQSFLDEGLYTSQIDFVEFPSEGQSWSEVRIIFSYQPHLISYFERLAYALWERFSIVEAELNLPQLAGGPVFASAAEYALWRASWAFYKDYPDKSNFLYPDSSIDLEEKTVQINDLPNPEDVRKRYGYNRDL